jgi:Na+/H+ antiporter NhaC
MKFLKQLITEDPESDKQDNRVFMVLALPWAVLALAMYMTGSALPALLFLCNAIMFFCIGADSARKIAAAEKKTEDE